MARFGVELRRPKIDADKLRDWKNKRRRPLTKGLSGLAKQRKVEVVRGEPAVFLSRARSRSR
jgi:dihydrolipoamide dehydrogenase